MKHLPLGILITLFSLLGYCTPLHAQNSDTTSNVDCPPITLPLEENFDTIPAVNYTDIFAVNLRNLFRKIRKKERISKEKFREEIRPLITEPLERYLMEQYHEEDPLWGIWYKAEDFPGGASACEAEVESRSG